MKEDGQSGEWAIVDENGPVEPQVGYVDGYEFADLVLQGILFKIEVKTNEEGLRELMCTCLHKKDCANFTDKYSARQMNSWRNSALQWAIDCGMTTEDGMTDLYWREANL